MLHLFFSLHCPGESGLGKSTLVDSLFLTDLYDDTAIPKAVGKFYQVCINYVKLFKFNYDKRLGCQEKQEEVWWPNSGLAEQVKQSWFDC